MDGVRELRLAGFGVLAVLLLSGAGPAPGAAPDSAPDAAPAVLVAAVLNGTATLEEHLALAFAQNPGLRAAFERWQAAEARAPQARALDDPTLSFGVAFDRMDRRSEVGLVQMFPPPGARRLRRRKAAAEARAAMHAFDAERFEVFERVTRAFHEYRYLGRAIEVTAENHRLLVELEAAVRARYEAEEAPFAELIQAQVERERLGDRLAALREERRPSSAALAALLNLSADVPLPWPTADATAPEAMDEDALAGILAELNPELKSAASRVEAAGYGEALARRGGWPRGMVGAEWMVMDGRDGRGTEMGVGVMAGATLPIWRGRVRAERREAAAQARAAEREREALHRKAREELSGAVFRYRDAGRRLGLYRETLLPLAGQALDAARQAYAEGRVGFTAPIDAQRTLLEYRLLAERAEADLAIALAEVRARVGEGDRTDRTDPSDPSDQLVEVEGLR